MSREKVRMDPRVRRTREMLWNALIALLYEKDYNKIRVNEIAERATLNRTTFYLHFNSKEDLLNQCFEEIMSELIHSIAMTPEEFNYEIDEPHPILVRLFEQIAIHASFYRTIMMEDKLQHLTRRMTKIMEQFITSGVSQIQADGIGFVVSTDIAIRYLTTAYMGVIGWWLENHMPYTPRHMAMQLTRMSSRGPLDRDPYLEKQASSRP